MTFPAALQRHRRSLLFCVFVLVAGGLAAAFRLPVTLFPKAEFPRVMVSLDAGDRPASQMEVQVTRLVEEAVRSVPGVTSIRSTTSRGSAEVSINFEWGQDMALTATQVSAVLSQTMPSLPTGTQADIRRMDPTVFPILAYSLTSNRLTKTQLYELAQYQLRPLLSSVAGVARVGVLGGAPAELHVTVNPDRLFAYGLTLADVNKALSAANAVSAVGRIEDHYKLYLVVSDTALHDPADIGRTIVRANDDGVVRVSDVATVTESSLPLWTRVTADGSDAVLLNIFQQPASNSVQIARDVKAKLAQFKERLPKDVRLTDWYDQSELVIAAGASVRDAILIGVVLAAGVLLVFLRRWRVTLIAVAVVPAALAATVVLLEAFHMSFNVMTLGGMAAAVGLIIDDAIVMIEHIVRRLQSRQDMSETRFMSAAMEFTHPLAGSSASTVIVFLPLAFLSGVTGAFFKALSITMACALVLSFVITWLALPLIAHLLLREHDAHVDKPGDMGGLGWLQARYERGLDCVTMRPWLTLAVIVPLLVFGWIAYQRVGSGFMPTMDEGGFILDYRAPAGTSLSETDRLLRQVESLLRATPDVASYSRRTGAGLGGGLNEANEGDFFVRLKSTGRRPIDEVMNEVRDKIGQQIPGLDVEMAQLMEDLIGDLTAVPQPIEVKLFADDKAKLGPLALKVADAIGRLSGVVEVRNGINPAGDALNIHVDRVKAALEGLDPDGVTQALSAALEGTVATQVVRSPQMIGVRVWLPRSSQASDSSLQHLSLAAPDGHLVPLGRIATIEAVSGQPQISRENLQQMVAVTARVSGTDMGSAVAAVRQALDRQGFMPSGAYYELGGLYEQQRIAFKAMAVVFAAALALVFILLLFLYERFRIALAILTVPLLSVPAVFIGLWITGTELNISATMGMTMIVGIVTEVAIFYFSEYRSLVEEGLPVTQALREAGKNRLRPILMTTLAAILTLMPLAFAIGQGSEMQQPLAIAIISGLLVQLPLTLVVMPSLFAAMLRRRDGVLQL